MPVLGLATAVGLYCGVEPKQTPEPTGQRAQQVGTACSAAALIAAINTANAASGAQVIDLPANCGIPLSAIDNYWYGPNALPPIMNDITINGDAQTGALITRNAAGGAPKFRIFYVAGSALPPFKAGKLTLHNVTVANGVAQGGSTGDSVFSGGGGMGAGGAILSHGDTVLNHTLFFNNSAAGGTSGNKAATPVYTGGGGMGGNATQGGGGGFQSNSGMFDGGHGAGTTGTGTTEGGNPNGNGGTDPGTGTEDATDTAVLVAGNSGGKRGLGGAGGIDTGGTGGTVGDGGTGGTGGLCGGGSGGGFGGDGSKGSNVAVQCGGGGAFGGGGASARGGGGAGGGGASGGSGGGGGFGGGGGGADLKAGNGGFGGGGGGSIATGGGMGGFGGGNGGAGATEASGGGGLGAGGAVFVHLGTLTVVNSTLTNNNAVGGTAGTSATQGQDGSGLGGAIFSLNATVTLVNATLSGNNSSSTTGGGALYALSFGKKADGTANESTTVTAKNTILADSINGDVTINNMSGSASIDVSVKTIVESTLTTMGGATVTGTAIAMDPMLAALRDNNGPLLTMYPQTGSPALDAGDATTCNSAPVSAVDQRGFSRPGTGCDIGAVEVGVNGSYCGRTNDPTCASTFCREGVCCNSDCGGGSPNDCIACRLLNGATQEGICGRRPGGGGSLCRNSAGSCDVQEFCTGSSDACPTDTFKPSGILCNNARAECDAPDYCTGTSPTCIDRRMPNTFTCRPAATGAAGACDAPEFCTGTSDVCPRDVVKSGSTVCRPSSMPCDETEYCDGSTKGCPTDAKKAAGVVCKPPGASLICDPEDYCDGIRSTCPARVAKLGTVCGTGKKCDANGLCK